MRCLLVQATWGHKGPGSGLIFLFPGGNIFFMEMKTHGAQGCWDKKKSSASELLDIIGSRRGFSYSF